MKLNELIIKLEKQKNKLLEKIVWEKDYKLQGYFSDCECEIECKNDFVGDCESGCGCGCESCLEIINNHAEKQINELENKYNFILENVKIENEKYSNLNFDFEWEISGQSMSCYLKIQNKEIRVSDHRRKWNDENGGNFGYFEEIVYGENLITTTK